MQGLRACVLKACVGENCACVQGVRACKACVQECVREGREGRAGCACVQGLRACVLEVCVRAKRVQGLCARMLGVRACKVCVRARRA